MEQDKRVYRFTKKQAKQLKEEDNTDLFSFLKKADSWTKNARNPKGNLRLRMCIN